MKREEILDIAKQCVCKTRNDKYGDMELNFEVIAKLWSWYLFGSKGIHIVIQPHESANMMILFKVARMATGKFNPDNYVDAAGYAACAAELQGKGVIADES